MSAGPTKFRGVVYGKMVELDHESGLPDGQRVSVVIEPAAPPEERLQRAFGSWANGGAELDQFLDQARQDRKHPRSDRSQ